MMVQMQLDKQQSSFDAFSLANLACDYLVDRTQRSILFWDIMRKRGNIYQDHIKDGQPAILLFEFDTVIDGKTLEQPVNYSLLQIIDRRQKKAKQPKLHKDRRRIRHGKILTEAGSPARPIVVIDPRAGHGPGIGGSKMSSQIGIALEYGHPVYFITFTTDPQPGQTISAVHQAEIHFLEEVNRRHIKAPRPAVIGNCQAGWAAALIGADRPDLTGPMIFNGSPLSYWGGVEGKNPMRYKGGLSGGIWLTSLMSDLGNDKFDGANLVAGFEDLNPANTYWTKYYNLFTNLDTEEQRFLRFEKWWGGFFKMNTDEIHFIVNKLFVGNELESGHLVMDDGRIINLKHFKTPILAFASEGDNITPPPQALNWIYKVYGTVEEIKKCGQVIIYMIHKEIGHLGIFVSGKIAKKEHRQILANIGWLEYMAPGLYEMVIDKEQTNGKEGYEVSFEVREMADLLTLDDGQSDEIPFNAVNGVSRFSDALYRTYLSPFVKAMIDESTAETIRQLHPLRSQRYIFSDDNPFCWPFKYAPEMIGPHRKIVDKNNIFVQLEELYSANVKVCWDYFRDIRDMGQEAAFKAIYATPWMENLFGDMGGSSKRELKSAEIEQQFLKKQQKELELLKKELPKGGYTEAAVRIMLAVAGADRSFDIREFQTAENIIQGSQRLKKMTPEAYQELIKKQAHLIAMFPSESLEAVAEMLPAPSDRKRMLKMAEEIAQADTELDDREVWALDILRKTLLIDTIKTVDNNKHEEN